MLMIFTSAKAEVMRSGRFGCHCHSVCLCAASRKKLCVDLHEIFTVDRSWPSLRVFYFGGDPDWPSLSFRGQNRPARSFRHKIDCSAETARDTAKVTIHYKTLIENCVFSHGAILDDLGAL